MFVAPVWPHRCVHVYGFHEGSVRDVSPYDKRGNSYSHELSIRNVRLLLLPFVIHYCLLLQSIIDNARAPPSYVHRAPLTGHEFYEWNGQFVSRGVFIELFLHRAILTFNLSDKSILADCHSIIMSPAIKSSRFIQVSLAEVCVLCSEVTSSWKPPDKLNIGDKSESVAARIVESITFNQLNIDNFYAGKLLYLNYFNFIERHFRRYSTKSLMLGSNVYFQIFFL